MTPAVAQSSTAVVCAAVSDHPTAFALSAAWEVEHLLRGRFGLISSSRDQGLLPYEPEEDGFYTALFAATHANPTAPRPVTFGYLSAHGETDGLYVARGGARPFFTAAMKPFFRDALVVLNCCLPGGDFPRDLCTGRDRARAVIGYNPALIFPSPDIVSRWWGTLGWAEVVAAFHRVLVEPVRALLETGVTAAEARRRTTVRWGELYRLPGAVGDLQHHLRHWAGLNNYCLTVWGDASATL